MVFGSAACNRICPHWPSLVAKTFSLITITVRVTGKIPVYLACFMAFHRLTGMGFSAREPSAFITALGAQGYQFGLFASDGFKSALYRQALLADFTLPAPVAQADAETTAQWKQWLASTAANSNPWFSYISLSGPAEAQDPVIGQKLPYPPILYVTISRGQRGRSANCGHP